MQNPLRPLHRRFGDTATDRGGSRDPAIPEGVRPPVRPARTPAQRRREGRAAGSNLAGHPCRRSEPECPHWRDSSCHLRLGAAFAIHPDGSRDWIRLFWRRVRPGRTTGSGGSCASPRDSGWCGTSKRSCWPRANNVIGRDPKSARCGSTLPGVSRQHARIRVDGRLERRARRHEEHQRDVLQRSGSSIA